MPGYSGNPPPWVRTLLRDQFSGAANTVIKELPRRFYISRKQNRKILNEDELLPLFKEHNIQSMKPEKLRYAEQIALFSRADHRISWCSVNKSYFKPG